MCKVLFVNLALLIHNLKRHIKSFHEGIKPIKCNICNAKASHFVNNSLGIILGKILGRILGRILRTIFGTILG
jgi:hypothetical protein